MPSTDCRVQTGDTASHACRGRQPTNVCAVGLAGVPVPCRPSRGSVMHRIPPPPRMPACCSCSDVASAVQIVQIIVGRRRLVE